MRKKQIRGAGLTAITAACVLLSGCSRAQVNYHLAESIGTVGKYENDEPVETPQMKAARMAAEAQSEEESQVQQQLDEGEKLASAYRYDEAIAYLEGLERTQSNTQAIDEAIERYKEAQGDLVVYEGDIPHLCFPGLIADTSMAFDGDDKTSSYNDSMVTVKEFQDILQSLYDMQYVLIDIHTVAAKETDKRGITTVEELEIKLPKGKKPIILSQDNLNYTSVRNGDGIATKLILNDEGKVKAVYTDSEGHDKAGDYDFIPVLDSFIEEHPDFSYQGARGIVSVSGSEGVFGYEISDVSSQDNKNRKAVSAILEALKNEGWSIASAGYAHKYMNDMSVQDFFTDLQSWEEQVGTLTGAVDILFYPYGAEVGYPSEKLDMLLEHGYVYLCGLWSDSDYRELGEGYLRQTRRFIDGYALQHAPEYFSTFFDVSHILDSDR